MNSAPIKRHPGKAFNAIFFIICITLVAIVLIYAPKLIDKTGIVFLSIGSGLNKALSVIIAVLCGWVVLLPSDFYKQSLSLIKGASVEWRKSVKPGKDEVMKTTMIVLAVVFAAAILISVTDWALFKIFNNFIR